MRKSQGRRLKRSKRTGLSLPHRTSNKNLERDNINVREENTTVDRDTAIYNGVKVYLPLLLKDDKSDC